MFIMDMFVSAIGAVSHDPYQIVLCISVGLLMIGFFVGALYCSLCRHLEDLIKKVIDKKKRGKENDDDRN